MSEFNNDQWHQRFEGHLIEQGYTGATIKSGLPFRKRFLCYLQEKDIAVGQVSPPILEAYFQVQAQRYQQRCGHPPRDASTARHLFDRGITQLLAFVQGQWPPPSPPANEIEDFHLDLYTGYVDWLSQCRGLSVTTIKQHHRQAYQFLTWLGERATAERLAVLTVKEIDAYFAAKARHHRRGTRAGLAYCLRSFLRYLHNQGLIDQDLAATVISPTRYALEGIPPALKPEDVDTVLAVAKQNRSPVGIRNYTILLLLAHYGLRSGEVVRLRLEDIDWRHDRFRIRQSKSGIQTMFPLLAPVGNALLEYLQTARPRTTIREVFVCAYAPHRPLASPYHIVARLLKKAGIQAEGRRGPHTFRHARAVSLLRQTVSLKMIGDLLGHRSSASTRVYLKLATEDLRDVALEVPNIEEMAP